MTIFDDFWKRSKMGKMKSNNKINVIFVFTVYVLPILAAQSIVYDHIKEACPKILKIIQSRSSIVEVDQRKSIFLNRAVFSDSAS